MGNSTKKLEKQQQKIREQKANFLFSYFGRQVPPLSWLQQNTTQQMGISESFCEFKCYKGKEKVIQYFRQKFSQNSYQYKIYSLLHSQRYSHKEAKTYKCVQIFFQMYRIDEIATKMQFNVQFTTIQPSKEQKICWVSLAYVPGYQVYKAIQNQSGYVAPKIEYLPPAPFVYELKKPDPEEIRKICQQNERRYHIGKWNQIHRAG